MYINIGENNIINTKNILGVFDIDKLTVYKNNREYLSICEKYNKIKSTTENLPKSFIICVNNNKNNNNTEKIYLSCLTCSTISKRISRL
ncbi:MAG: DUF370 domain-containing protein [Clostridia bacterium]|nr:DUF370 domain-containing protein [Clostridia bacterium]